jgi:hypothetical protein
MGTGAEVAGPAAAKSTAEALAAAEAGMALGSGSATAATLGGASGLAGAGSALAGGLEAAGGMSYAQPSASAITGLAPNASYAQSALIPGGAFATGAAGGAAAGAAGSQLLDAGSFGYGGPEPGAWDTVKGGLDKANAAWNGLGTFGQAVAQQVGQAALQGVMGDGGEGTQRPTTSFGGAQAVPLRQQGLYGSAGTPVDPTATTAAMGREAPVAPTGNAQAAPSMPGSTGSSNGNGGVKLGKKYTQYT